MGIYGSYAKQLMEQNSIDSRAEQMTLEEFKDSLLENYMSVFEQMEEGETEVVEEGANLDLTNEWRNATKEVKAHLKDYKKNLKAKDFKKAASDLDAASKILKASRKKMEEIDAESVGSAVLGYFANGLVGLCEIIVPYTVYGIGLGITTGGAIKAQGMAMDAMLGADVSEKALKGAAATTIAGGVITTAAGIVSIVKAIIILVKDIKTWIKEFKKDGEKLDVKHFNLYRNKLLRLMDDMIKKVDKLKDQVSKAKAKEEK